MKQNVIYIEEKRQSRDWSQNNPDTGINKDFKAAITTMLKLTKENKFVINEQIGNFSREIKTQNITKWKI